MASFVLPRVRFRPARMCTTLPFSHTQSNTWFPCRITLLFSTPTSRHNSPARNNIFILSPPPHSPHDTFLPRFYLHTFCYTSHRAPLPNPIYSTYTTGIRMPVKNTNIACPLHFHLCPPDINYQFPSQNKRILVNALMKVHIGATHSETFVQEQTTEDTLNFWECANERVALVTSYKVCYVQLIKLLLPCVSVSVSVCVSACVPECERACMHACDRTSFSKSINVYHVMILAIVKGENLVFSEVLSKGQESSLH